MKFGPVSNYIGKPRALARLATGVRNYDPFPGASFGADFRAGKYKLNGLQYGNPASIPGWSFTRASTGYAATSGGVLVPFATGAPRITDKGLLVEELRATLLQNSLLTGGGAVPTNWSQQIGTGTSAATTSTYNPAGIAYAQTASATRPFIGQTVTVAIATYRLSYQIEAVTGGLVASDLIIHAPGTAGISATSWPVCSANPSGGASGVVQAGKLEYEITFSGAGTVYPRIGLGCNGAVTGTLRLSCPNFELGTFSTSFIASPAGASATRAADTPSIVVAPAFPLTVVVQGTIDPASSIFASIDDGSTSNRAQIYTTSGSMFALVTAAGVTTANLSIAGVLVGVRQKIAARIALDNVNMARNGTLGTADTSAAMPVGVNNIGIGCRTSSPSRANGYIESIIIYPRALTDAELQAATA